MDWRELIAKDKTHRSCPKFRWHGRTCGKTGTKIIDVDERTECSEQSSKIPHVRKQRRKKNRARR